MFAVGVGPGDEVIVPTYTFWASATPACWLGARPVFCDIEPQTLGADPDDIARRITPRTRAIVVVHCWGLPANMEKIMALARRHGIAVIEDASHAHGAEALVNGQWQKVGTIGDVGCFSFQATKPLVAGEGGMLVTNDEQIFRKAVALGHYERLKQFGPPLSDYAWGGFGLKLRIAAMSAAFARSQLRRLDETNARHRRTAEAIARLLEEFGAFDTYCFGPDARRVFYQWHVRLLDGAFGGRTVDEVVAAFRKAGLPASATRYPLLHQQPFFNRWPLHQPGMPLHSHVDRHPPGAFARQPPLPVAESLRERLIGFPMLANLSDADLNDLLNKLRCELKALTAS